MRAYIISAIYPPEPLTGAQTSADIAEEMTRRGHEVVVFAPFPNRPAGKVMRGYRRTRKFVENRNGYKIIRSWHTLSRRSTLASRTAENISFGITSTLQLMREKKPDVVYMNTWPLFAQWLNTRILSWRGVPVICAVKDLYPESFIGGKHDSKNNPMIALARAIDRRVYNQSTLVAPLNSIMAEYISSSRAISPDKVRVANDWVDASHFSKNQPKLNEFRKLRGFAADLFIAMYVGSMTRMAGLELYVETAEKLCHRQDIRILLVGDGAMREKIELMIKQKGLQNIQVVYPLKPEAVPEVQAASDVLMLSLMPGSADHALPSKLIFYMLSQRPIVASVKDDSPPARIIKDAGCGYVIRQGDSADLAGRLERMADDRGSLHQLGENAHGYAEENFSKEKVLPRVCDMIERSASLKRINNSVTNISRESPRTEG